MRSVFFGLLASILMTYLFLNILAQVAPSPALFKLTIGFVTSCIAGPAAAAVWLAMKD